MKILIALIVFFAFHVHAHSPNNSPNNSQNRTGTYMVPTQELDLLPYATFEVPRVRVEKQGAIIHLKYEFPKGLKGSEMTVELSGQEQSDGSWALSGSVGSLTCHLVDGYRACLAQYYGMNIDKGVRDQYLRSISKSPEELDKRLRIANIFSGDSADIQPLRIGSDGERIGVLRFLETSE